MRRLINSVLVLAYASASGAHTLSPDAGLVAGLGHQLSGGHHLPLWLLLALAFICVTGIRLSVGRRSTRR